MKHRRHRYRKPLSKGELAALLGLFMLVLGAMSMLFRPHAVPHLLADAVSGTTVQPSVNIAQAMVPAQPSTTGIFGVVMPVHTRPTTAHVLGYASALSRVIVGHAVTTQHPTAFWFHGRKYVYWKTLLMRVTSYAPDRRCCWPFAGTTTASGASVHTNDGHLVAADTHIIPFHCLVSVPGYDNSRPVPVLDRGGAIRGYRLDVLQSTFQRASNWGSRLLYVRVFRPVAEN